ncbi:RmlC-like cupin [Aspergillus leporis]|uniref:RmlC-like cupin n=1 Tax=Aspergillus leporis TaxID=41062 RepID=A0A5N5X713_9EURO|nr:RmlC-like cupin [Aspergillus leporis]
MPTKTQDQPIVLSPSAISKLQLESFEDPSRGEVSWRTLFTRPKTLTSDLSAGIAVCHRKSGYLCSHHHAQAEIYYVLEGRGVVTIDGVHYNVKKESVVFIPGDVEHSVTNNEDDELK